jgi:hypothetical protein
LLTFPVYQGAATILSQLEGRGDWERRRRGDRERRRKGDGEKRRFSSFKKLIFMIL